MAIFEIHLKALSPISVTERVFGILYKTYRYIPAWTMWNTLVKLYAIEQTDGIPDYKSAQDNFKLIRLTNFYPLINKNGETKLYYPFSNDSKIINKMDEKEIISSDLKVAIDPLLNASEYGALYEREYLTAKEFIGWIKIENWSFDSLGNFFMNKLTKKMLFIGADKNTGFGKAIIKTISDKENDFLKSKTVSKIIAKLKETEGVKNKENVYLIPPEIDEKDYFPLVLRMWDNEKGSGEKIEKIQNHI